MVSGQSRTSPKVLVLWDIDHTLIESRGVGPALYRRAFLAATGRELETYPIVAGRTELGISSEMLRLHGLESNEGAVRTLIEALVREFQLARSHLARVGRALPGAKETLALLAAEPSVHQSVLTGNVRALAQIKLETFGLDCFLDLDSGAFGDESCNRADLVRLAQQRANARTGHKFADTATVLIGDSPNDIRAGREAGVRVIAVATGASTAEQLSAAGGDPVIFDLTDQFRTKSLIVNPQML